MLFLCKRNQREPDCVCDKDFLGGSFPKKFRDESLRRFLSGDGRHGKVDLIKPLAGEVLPS